MITPIIGFGHASRVGKDEAARAIEEYMSTSYLSDLEGSLGCQRLKFFDTGKQAAEVLFGCYGLREAEFYETEEGKALRDVPLPGINKTPVELWIELGDKIREIHPTVYTDAGMSLAKPNSLNLFSDVRFETEAKAIQKAGGWVVKIFRFDAPPPKKLDKPLEDWGNWNAILRNDGDLEAFKLAAIELCQDYLAQLGQFI